MINRALKTANVSTVLIILVFAITIILTLYFPVVIDTTVGGATVNFQVNSALWYSECIPVHWDVEGIKEVHLNQAGQAGHGEDVSCTRNDILPELRVKFVNDSMRSFGPEAILAVRYKALFQLIAAVILLLTIRSVQTRTPFQVSKLAGPMLFGILTIFVPRSVLEPIAPLVESLFTSSLNVFHLADGIVPLVLFACLIATLYWFVVPRRWRYALLGLSSVLALLLLGASLEFTVLALVLVVITHIAGSRIATPTEETARPNRPVQIAAFFYILLVELLVLNAALWTGFGAIFSNPLVLASLFVITVFLSVPVIRQMPKLNIGAKSASEKQSAPLSMSLQLIFGLWSLWIVGHFIPLSLTILTTQILSILILLYLGVFVLVATRILERGHIILHRRILAYTTICVIVLAFLFGKWPLLSVGTSFVGWIGFSYFAFRLLHVLIDSLNRRFYDVSPQEMIIYALFYPALLVGPIDRLPLFLKNLRAGDQQFSWKFVAAGLTRIAIGTLKKFLVADILLAPLALGIGSPPPYNTINAWTQVIVYSFYILLDFSGYIDIVLGIGYLVGFTLPENFDSPYLKTNLVQFWQAWHITLSNWLRSYIFFPLSGRLLRSSLRKHPNIVVFIAQMTTMLLIGLWHGITINFAMWGIWHGIGLFLHKLYSDRSKRYVLQLADYPTLHSLYSFGGWAVTFAFVSLGWVFFALPNISASEQVFRALFSIR